MVLHHSFQTFAAFYSCKQGSPSVPKMGRRVYAENLVESANISYASVDRPHSR
jgi:hypothetical protein